MTSTAAASGSCSAWLIRSAATQAGSAVSSATIMISVGPASESMPTLPITKPLGCRHPHVAGAGDQVDGRARRPAAGIGAVGQQRDGLRAADRVDLVDAEQCARRQDRRVRPAVVVALRRRHHRDRPDPGDLGRDDVHDHARRVDGPAAGHVQADPAHRDPALARPPAGDDRGRDPVGRWSAWTRRTRSIASSSAAPDRGVEVGEAPGDDRLGDPHRRRDAVEPLRSTPRRRGARARDVPHDRCTWAMTSRPTSRHGARTVAASTSAPRRSTTLITRLVYEPRTRSRQPHDRELAQSRHSKGGAKQRRRSQGAATPATTVLAHAGVPYALHAYQHDPRADEYGIEAAQELGVDPKRVFKTLVAESTANWSWRWCRSAASWT